MRSKLEAITKKAQTRAIAASALLVPLAAIVGGINRPNHNETVVRTA
jgi:hypothetical protein